MAHFAEIGEDNRVLRVIVVANENRIKIGFFGKKHIISVIN
jgi:hypothetical protein